MLGGLDISMLPRNSRERLTAAPSEFAVQSPTKRRLATSRMLHNHQPAVTQFSSHCYGKYNVGNLFKWIPYQWILIAGVFFFTSLLWCRANWRSTGLTPSSSQLAELHNLFHQLENRLTLVNQELNALQHKDSSHTSAVDSLRKDTLKLRDELHGAVSQNDALQTAIHADLQDSLQNLSTEIKLLDTEIRQLEKKYDSQLNVLSNTAQPLWNDDRDFGSSLTSPNDQKLLKQLFRALYLDGTGKPDWARASLGGSIISEFTSIPRSNTAWNLFKWKIIAYFPRYYGKAKPISKPADIVIGGPESAALGFASGNKLTPGYCFAFDGSQGNITLRLPTLVNVSEVHIDHIAHDINPSTSTAPKRFAVYVDNCGILPCRRRVNFSSPPSTLVGIYDFNYTDLTSQTFQLKLSDRHIILPTRRIRIEIQSNYGGHYTCIYRLRVHGVRTEEQTKQPFDVVSSGTNKTK